MAGDWIPIRKGLEKELEVLRMSVILRADTQLIVGALVAFWDWCDFVTDDGILKGVKLSEMSAFCPQCVRNLSLFFDALRIVGWIVEHDDCIEIPNYERWLGNTAKKRLKEQRRKQNNRNAGRNVRFSSANCPQSVPPKAGLEKRREENRNNPLPPALRSPEMQTALASWQQHRAELGKPLTSASYRSLITQLETWGPARSLAAIRHSLVSGYLGLVEPRHGGAAANGASCESTADCLARIQRETAERRKRDREGALSGEEIRSKLRKSRKSPPNRDGDGQTARESS